jgi:hypothetical protein
MSDAIDMGELLRQAANRDKVWSDIPEHRLGDVAASATAPAVCHPHRITCVMCGKTKTVIALESMPDKPILCHSCYRQVIPQYPALPTQVIGRYCAGPSFLDEYVDKRPEVV